MGIQSEAHGIISPSITEPEPQDLQPPAPWGLLIDRLGDIDAHLFEACCSLVDASAPAREMPDDFPFEIEPELEELRDMTRKLARRAEALQKKVQRWAEGPLDDASTIADARFHEAREDGRI